MKNYNWCQYIVETKYSEPLVFVADFARSECPIMTVSKDDYTGEEEWHSTPFQVADCSHLPYEMAVMLLDYYDYTNPADEDDGEPDEDGEYDYVTTYNNGLTREEYLKQSIISIKETVVEENDEPYVKPREPNYYG